jgi:hypothetical protein
MRAVYIMSGINGIDVSMGAFNAPIDPGSFASELRISVARVSEYGC